MKKLIPTQWVSLSLAILAVVLLGNFAVLSNAFGRSSIVQTNSATMASSSALTLTTTANLEPTDPTYWIPVSTITAIRATYIEIGRQMATFEPLYPRSRPGGMETWASTQATQFAAQSTYVAQYNQSVEAFMTAYVQTPENMRTPAEPTFITLPPPIDEAKITPIIITLGPALTQTPTSPPMQATPSLAASE